MRAMGLDIGSVTVGVALSDGLKMIASSYTVIRYEQENDELFKKKRGAGILCKISVRNPLSAI